MKVSDMKKKASMLLQTKKRDLVRLILKFAAQSKILVGTRKVWKFTTRKRKRIKKPS